ncbi:MAG: GAK system XXXCH domain-containing protein [Thermodesulfobacteriota bacterium]|nr:GAK system XXXCH domain-containing protein [Thermodesulfobacteriota bacterium]
MSEKERKIEKTVSMADLPDLFRGLAARFSGNVDAEEFWPDFETIRKLKIEIKKAADGVVVCYKAKREPAAPSDKGDEAPSGEDKESYKQLKKRMKGSFKAIRKSLEQEALPDQETVDAFVKDSYEMMAFNGKGDAYYKTYKKAVDEFKKVYKQADVALLRTSLDNLEDVKNKSHDIYK